MSVSILSALALLITADHGNDSHAHHHAQDAAAQSVVAADVRTVNTDARTTLLRHEAMSELGMPSMVMEFAVAENVDINLFQPGAALTITVTTGDDGLVVIAAEPEIAE